jgi:uncharacterized membrane protein (Fun14 family)
LKTLFSAGGGFLLGAVAGYAIKKVMKVASVVIGLFVASLAYLSYKGWVDVKWAAMDDASRSTLTNASEQLFTLLTIRQHASICYCDIRLTNSSYVWICPGTYDGD